MPTTLRGKIFSVTALCLFASACKIKDLSENSSSSASTQLDNQFANSPSNGANTLQNSPSQADTKPAGPFLLLATASKNPDTLQAMISTASIYWSTGMNLDLKGGGGRGGGGRSSGGSSDSGGGGGRTSGGGDEGVTSRPVNTGEIAVTPKEDLAYNKNNNVIVVPHGEAAAVVQASKQVAEGAKKIAPPASSILTNNARALANGASYVEIPFSTLGLKGNGTLRVQILSLDGNFTVPPTGGILCGQNKELPNMKDFISNIGPGKSVKHKVGNETYWISPISLNGQEFFVAKLAK